MKGSRDNSILKDALLDFFLNMKLSIKNGGLSVLKGQKQLIYRFFAIFVSISTFSPFAQTNTTQKLEKHKQHVFLVKFPFFLFFGSLNSLFDVIKPKIANTAISLEILHVHLPFQILRPLGQTNRTKNPKYS